MKAELLWLERRAIGEPRSSLLFSLSSPSGKPLVPGESWGILGPGEVQLGNYFKARSLHGSHVELEGKRVISKRGHNHLVT